MSTGQSSSQGGRLAGRSAVITGGASGIGVATVVRSFKLLSVMEGVLRIERGAVEG